MADKTGDSMSINLLGVATPSFPAFIMLNSDNSDSSRRVYPFALSVYEDMNVMNVCIFTSSKLDLLFWRLNICPCNSRIAVWVI